MLLACTSACTIHACTLLTLNTWSCSHLLQGTPSLEALKLQYYALMIRFYQHECDWLEVCRCYRWDGAEPQSVLHQIARL